MLSAEEWQAVRLTLVVAAVALMSSLPLALAIAWLMAKWKFPGKPILEVLVNLPLVLPPVVTGYLLMVLLGRKGPIGGFIESSLGIRFIFDWKGAVVASAIVSFPLLVRPIRQAFEQVDDRLLHAARTLGAGHLDTFFSIALPLAFPGICSGCILAFARSIGEFGATLMIAGSIPGETQTISLMVYSLLDSPGGIRVSLPLVSASIVLAASALFIGEKMDRLQRRRMQGNTK